MTQSNLAQKSPVSPETEQRKKLWKIICSSATGSFSAVLSLNGCV